MFELDVYSTVGGYHSALLFIISFVSIFFSIYTIISKNPVISVLFLIGLFVGISLYLIVIGLQFLGLSYILVYIGAISILFLFILMLINVRISELVTDNSNSITLSILIILLFNYSSNDKLPYGVSRYDLLEYNVFESIIGVYSSLGKELFETLSLKIVQVTETIIAFVNCKIWETILIESTHIASIGNIMYTVLFMLFITSSLILLLAMVGAIMITINKSVSATKTIDYNAFRVVKSCQSISHFA